MLFNSQLFQSWLMEKPPQKHQVIHQTSNWAFSSSHPQCLWSFMVASNRKASFLDLLRWKMRIKKDQMTFPKISLYLGTTDSYISRELGKLLQLKYVSHCPPAQVIFSLAGSNHILIWMNICHFLNTIWYVMRKIQSYSNQQLFQNSQGTHLHWRIP